MEVLPRKKEVKTVVQSLASRYSPPWTVLQKEKSSVRKGIVRSWRLTILLVPQSFPKTYKRSGALCPPV